jgi:conjugative transfer signal peptidase TraF
MIRAASKAPPAVFGLRLTGLVAIALAPYALAITIGPRFALNWTASMPRGLYWRSAPTSAIARGVTVIACVPQPYAALAHQAGYLDAGVCDGVSTVLKTVAAVAGDRVVLSAAGVAVNGAQLEGSRPLLADEQGRPVRHVPFGTYVLRPGQVWLASPKQRSYDSRYFGPVPVGNVQTVAWPVFVIDYDVQG